MVIFRFNNKTWIWQHLVSTTRLWFPLFFHLFDYETNWVGIHDIVNIFCYSFPLPTLWIKLTDKAFNYFSTMLGRTQTMKKVSLKRLLIRHTDHTFINFWRWYRQVHTCQPGWYKQEMTKPKAKTKWKKKYKLVRQKRADSHLLDQPSLLVALWESSEDAARDDVVETGAPERFVLGPQSLEVEVGWGHLQGRLTLVHTLLEAWAWKRGTGYNNSRVHHP